MDHIFYYLFSTSLGACGMAWKGPERPAVVFLQLPDTTDNLTEERIAGSTGGQRSNPPPSIAEIAERIRMHLNGRVQDFSNVRVDLEGIGSFTQQVLAACRNIPA